MKVNQKKNNESFKISRTRFRKSINGKFSLTGLVRFSYKLEFAGFTVRGQRITTWLAHVRLLSQRTLFISFFLLLNIVQTSCCPCRYCGPTTLCHQMNLQEVPYTIPTGDVMRLLLYGNLIEKVSDNEFEGMFKVIELDLHDNKIRLVENNAFAGLKNVESLHLSNNEIEYIPQGALLTMPKLSRLFLDNNKLKRLPDDVPYLSGLVKLNVGNNLISTIQWTSFIALNQLDWIILWSNPLRCDCTVHELIKWFTGTTKGLSVSTDRNTLACSEDDLLEKCTEMEISYFSTEEHDRTLKAVYIQNQEAKLHCNVTGRPTPLVVWKTPSAGYVFPYSLSRLTAYMNGTLVINNLRPSDSGKYFCLPRHAVHQGMTSPSIKLTVLRGVKPQIFATKERMDGAEGNEITLSCSLSGNPQPEVSWHHTAKDEQGNISSLIWKEKVKTVDNVTLLTIKKFSEENAGLWECEATNVMGTATAFIQVNYITTNDNLIMIIIVTVCVVTAAVIAAVVVVTCLVLHRRRKIEANHANRRRTTKEPETGISRVIETRDTKRTDDGHPTTENAPTYVNESEAQIERKHVIIKQPFTVEPEVKGIRI